MVCLAKITAPGYRASKWATLISSKSTWATSITPAAAVEAFNSASISDSDNSLVVAATGDELKLRSDSRQTEAKGGTTKLQDFQLP